MISQFQGAAYKKAYNSEPIDVLVTRELISCNKAELQWSKLRGS